MHRHVDAGGANEPATEFLRFIVVVFQQVEILVPHLDGPQHP